MKKILILIALVCFGIVSFAQQNIVADNVTVTNSIVLKDSTVTGTFAGVLPDTNFVNERISDYSASDTGNMKRIVYDVDNDSIVDTSEVSVDFRNSVAYTIDASDINRWDSAVSISDTIINYLSTGIISGFTISINADPTKINIAAGIGNIIDNSNPADPAITRINYVGQTAITLTYLATSNATYLAINSSGTVIQQTTPFTNTQRRTLILIGAAIHSNRTIVNAVNNLPDVILGTGAQYNDLLDALGNFNISGNIFTYNGANLNINKSSGYIYKRGANFNNDASNPHKLNLASLTAPTNIRYRLQDGTEYSNTAVIDPDYYDLAGVRTIVPVNNFSIQRITVFSSNLVRIQYGQAVYANMAEAIAAINTESFVVEENIAANGLLRCLLIVKRGTTALNNSSNAKFLDVDRFGGVQSSASGSPLSTLLQAYNNSVQPQITTSTALGEVQIMRGSASDNDTVFSILNGVGQTKLSVLGTGKLTNDSIITQNIIVGNTLIDTNSVTTNKVTLQNSGATNTTVIDSSNTKIVVDPVSERVDVYNASSLLRKYNMFFDASRMPNTEYIFGGGDTLIIGWVSLDSPGLLSKKDITVAGDTIFLWNKTGAQNSGIKVKNSKLYFNNTFLSFGVTWIPNDIYSYSLYYDPDSLHFCWARLQEFRLDTLDRINANRGNFDTLNVTGNMLIDNFNATYSVTGDDTLGGSSAGNAIDIVTQYQWINCRTSSNTWSTYTGLNFTYDNDTIEYDGTSSTLYLHAELSLGGATQGYEFRWYNVTDGAALPGKCKYTPAAYPTPLSFTAKDVNADTNDRYVLQVRGLTATNDLLLYDGFIKITTL